MRIGVDLMGSDNSPLLLFEAVLQAVREFDHLIVCVLATPKVIEAIHLLPHFSHLDPTLVKRIQFYPIHDVIEMGDEPLLAIRQKKNASLPFGMRLLKKSELDAFITAGNTGALIACATLFLPLFPGIKRPALLALLPTKKRDVAIIDVGGYVSCKAHHLIQFAYMGAAYQTCAQGIAIPRVGLLNIGVESKKGTSEIQHAYQLLQSQAKSESFHPMHFVGNIEGRELFEGLIDVLVTDGFTGNVLLKTSEGASYFLLEQLKLVLEEHSPEKAKPILNHLYRLFDYEEYAGAIVCGVDSIAVKCHGQISAKGMFNSIQGAVRLVKAGFLHQIKKQLCPYPLN